MIDYFALALTHGLLLVALLRLVGRSDVDSEPLAGEEAGKGEETPTRPGRRAHRRASGRHRNA